MTKKNLFDKMNLKKKQSNFKYKEKKKILLLFIGQPLQHWDAIRAHFLKVQIISHF
jgi:hypothetical protein